MEQGRAAWALSAALASLASLAGCVSSLPAPEGSPDATSPLDRKDARSGLGDAVLVADAHSMDGASTWIGPFALYTGPSAAVPPTCPPGFRSNTVQGYTTLTSIPSAVCAGCSCGGQTGASCTANVILHNNACGLAGGGCATGTVAGASLGASCEGLPNTESSCVVGGTTEGVVQSYGVDVTPVTGSCSAGGGGVSSLPAPVGTVVIACEATPLDAGGCDGGASCTPSVPPNFNAVCIESNGDTPCPAGPYQMQVIVYQVDDARGCSSAACVCQASAPDCTDGTVAIYSQSSCNGAAVSSVSPLPTGTTPPCTMVASPYFPTDTPYYAKYSLDNALPTTCTPTPTTPPATGTVTLVSPVTFCCSG